MKSDPYNSPATYAQNAYRLGKEYLVAFEVLCNSEEKAGILRATYNNLFQAIELFLKANLLTEGVEYRRFNNSDLGHDLVCLYNETKNIVIKRDVVFRETVFWMNEVGSDYGLRYPDGYSIKLPKFSEIGESLCAIMLEVEASTIDFYLKQFP